MKHLGDITKINGYEVPIVDVITGGSPCQDLSVAGKRAGLDGERSGLFMEQIRIVREMRDECIRQLQLRGADDISRHIRPRFLVWENVPGAFSSNKGDDFRCVLEEICRIADKTANVPMPEKGKWSTSGCIVGDGYSVAWRVHDAQFWGVPQRRKRISLVADFGGSSAPEILFERKGVSGDIAESREEGQGAATDIERGINKTIGRLNPWDVQSKSIFTEDSVCQSLCSGTTEGMNIQPCVLQNKAISFQERAGKPGGGKGILIQNERTGALSTLNNQSVCYGISAYESNSMKSSNPHSGIYEADTSRTLDLNGGNPACNQGGMMVVQGADMYNQSLTGEKTMSITGAATDPHHIPCVVLEGNGQRESHKGDGYKESDVMYTLNTVEQHAVCIENYMADSKIKKVYDWHRQDTRMTECKDVCVTCAAGWGGGGNNMPYVLEQPIYTIGHDERSAQFTTDEKTDPLTASDYKDPIKIADCRNTYQEKVGTLSVGAHDGSYNGQDAYNDMFVANQSIVRRLTPLECERLQGFPMVDGKGWTDIGEWTDTKGKKHKDADSPRYKALGNSIALPYWSWMANRMVKVLKDDGVENPTMASLFDGIGGFPLVYSRCGCKPIWASEIEEFPIAVTKLRFPEEV